MTPFSYPKKILALALLLINSFAFSNSEYFYNELDGGIEITGCTGECLVLPEQIDGKSVIGISDSAFNISIFIGVRWSLGWNCRFNDNIDLPDILILGEGSDFEDSRSYSVCENSPNLHNVTSIKIPESYQYIGENFFSSNSLKNVSLNKGIQTIGMRAFSSNAIRDIVIPDSVIEISNDAFSMNPLSHVIFLGNRPNIGSGAFLTPYDRASCLLAARENSLDASISCPYPIQYPVSPTQEGWGPIQPPGVLAHPFDNSYADSLLDAIPGSEHENHLNESFVLGFNELTELASQFPELEISTFTLFEEMYPSKIYYCSGNSGWPGEPLNGVIPEGRDCDSVVWDIDQNNSVDALTDGLMLMRYAFGLRGDSLTDNTVSYDSLVNSSEVEHNIEQIMHLVDINDDGTFDALTDGLILLRYLFDVTGNGLVDEEMFTSNRPSSGSIKAYIESYMIKELSN